jgi:hypothetical protein
MSASLEIPLRFGDMAVGDENPFSFDWVKLGWTTPADPVVSAEVRTSEPTELVLIGDPGVQNSVVTFRLGGGCANTEYAIFCSVTMQFGRKATRRATVYVANALPD